MARSRKEKLQGCIRMNLLTILTVFGTLGGLIFGIILRSSKSEAWTQREIMYIAFPGNLFLNILKGLILPLIISSIVSAIGSLDLSLSGKIGAKAICYYLCTTVLAVILGIIMCVTIRPGKDYDVGEVEDLKGRRNVTTVDTLLDLVSDGKIGVRILVGCIEGVHLGEAKRNLTLFDWKMDDDQDNLFVTGSNTLGMVVFSVVMGITLAKMKVEGRALLAFFDSLSAAMLMMTSWVIWVSPLGVFFLIAGKIIEMKSLSQLAGQLGWYFSTVMLGLTIHGFVVLPTLFIVATRRLPFRFIFNLAEACTTAFGTGSSNATLPVSMKCLEEKNNVDTRVSKFMMPIGATINMDGTALYEAVAALFIAQVRNVQLSLGQILAVSVTATMASIGAAGIPQAGLVTMVMVLDTVGLDSKDVTIILAVDWLLDRFRTTVNVLGDALGAGIVDHLSKGELARMTENAEELSDVEEHLMQPVGNKDNMALT
uniref:Amino acid transporter n=1 Tax=Timema shepardi TaxID=629360 RepID=A0A7R9AKI6_TIMSH|nr:unnamed protein product [Timema shepardi]